MDQVYILSVYFVDLLDKYLFIKIDGNFLKQSFIFFKHTKIIMQ